IGPGVIIPRVMRVVVTGASGHVGANLVRALRERGDTGRALAPREDAAREGLDAERVRGDVLDSDSLVRAFEGAELVYHLAALISIDGDRGGAVPAIHRGGGAKCRRARPPRGCSTSGPFQLDPCVRSEATRPASRRDTRPIRSAAR